MVPDSRVILEFAAVTSAPDPWYDAPITNATFALQGGDLALFRFNHQAPRSPIADAAMGLVELLTGQVRFGGRRWQDFSPTEEARRRGNIGRLFGMHGWVNHLDVDENITLRLRHHTRRPLPEIEQEAAALARAFGLRELPRTRPANLDVHDLQRAACVRMLLGSPMLLIVDEPPSGFYPDVLQALRPQVATARQRGAATIWLTADRAVWADEALRATIRGEAAQPGLGLLPVPTEAAI